MREVTYYRWAATLPVVLPFIADLFYRDDAAIGLVDRVTIPLYVSGSRGRSTSPSRPRCSGGSVPSAPGRPVS